MTSSFDMSSRRFQSGLETIKIVDVAVSFDKSGHAALPWGIVKCLLMVGNQTMRSWERVSRD
jgi:hypothetical protein